MSLALAFTGEGSSRTVDWLGPSLIFGLLPRRFRNGVRPLEASISRAWRLLTPSAFITKSRAVPVVLHAPMQFQVFALGSILNSGLAPPWNGQMPISTSPLFAKAMPRCSTRRWMLTSWLRRWMSSSSSWATRSSASRRTATSTTTSETATHPGARLRAGTAQEPTEAGDDAQEAREQLLEALGAEADEEDEEDDGGGEPR